MKVSFYFDDNCADRRVIVRLNADGFSAVSPVDVGMDGRPDPDHLTYAASHGQVLVTSDEADFLRLHSEWVRNGLHHAGIIIVKQQRQSRGELLRRLTGLATWVEALKMVDWVEYLSHWGSVDE